MDNTSKGMGINFYEIKTQLPDLGFTEPPVVDQLREAMFTGYDCAALRTDRDKIRIQINLDKNLLETLNSSIMTPSYIPGANCAIRSSPPTCP
ncbi:hypothetical protein [Mucilaginibacter aquariorum]|uniref:Uncharacterized protein n=1 Tax=Mucilaginibacter aquariorum TaxID=2967225 RepID=A0ABT1SY96_9SPHI|nr:hypothetical protein [Mucilaginibacter aquariorum]MCQ6957314.1 hypothetical protein [Mucilaginibacter aquariorum]